MSYLVGHAQIWKLSYLCHSPVHTTPPYQICCSWESPQHFLFALLPLGVVPMFIPGKLVSGKPHLQPGHVSVLKKTQLFDVYSKTKVLVVAIKNSSLPTSPAIFLKCYSHTQPLVIVTECSVFVPVSYLFAQLHLMIRNTGEMTLSPCGLRGG